MRFRYKDGYMEFDLCWNGWKQLQGCDEYDDNDAYGNEKQDDGDDDENDVPDS